MLNDYGYVEKAIANIREVAEKQEENIKAAAKLMADAIADDRLINVYAGGGHTTLAMGEMFFRAGGLANINPLMETALSVFNQALKYLELERTVNYGSAIIKYSDLKKDDVLIIFHNIGINVGSAGGKGAFYIGKSGILRAGEGNPSKGLTFGKKSSIMREISERSKALFAKNVYSRFYYFMTADCLAR